MSLPMWLPASGDRRFQQSSANNQRVFLHLGAEWRLPPQSNPAAKCITVRSAAHLLWKFLQLRRVAATNNNTIGNKSGTEIFDHCMHDVFPLFPSQLFQAGFSNQLAERVLSRKAQFSELQRH